MPNHEDNYVTIIGKPESIRRFIAEALTDQPEGAEPAKILDFGKIRPMPDELRQTVSPHEIADSQEEADQKNAEYNAMPFSKFGRGDDDPPQIKYMTMAEELRRITEYGAVDWYAWALANYGTKWGAYEHTHYQLRWLDSGNEVEGIYGRIDLTFQTAWSQPTPIFEAIEARWDVVVHCVTQDEGGFPDVEYGNPYDEEVIRKVITFEFDSYDREVDEPVEVTE